MTLRDFCKKYDTVGKFSSFLELNIEGKQFLHSVIIAFHDTHEPSYTMSTAGGYISIGKLNELKNQVEEAYDLLKSYHNFLCELKLDEELTEEQETILETIVHALS